MSSETDPIAPLSLADPQALLDTHPTPTLCLNPSGRLRWANAAAVALLGRTATTVGAHAADAFEPAAAPIDAALLCCRTNARWVRARSAELPAGGSLVSLEDAQAQVSGQHEARQLRDLLDLAQDFGRLGVWHRDLETLAGRWDRHVSRIWGLDPGAPTPTYQAAIEAIVPEDRDGLDRAFKASLNKAGSYAHRYRVRRPDGSLRRIHSQWVIVDGAQGRPASVLGVMVDDTDAWVQARAHDEIESQLILADGLTGIVRWVRDLRTERIHYDHQAVAMLGFEPQPDGMSTVEFRAHVHPDDLPGLQEAGERAIRTGVPVDVEGRYLHADGSWIHVLTRRTLKRDDEGQPIALLGIAIDITARHKADMALRRAGERAALAARGAGLGTWELDLETGDALWDEQMWRLRGREPAASAPDVDIMLSMTHPEDRDYAAAKIVEAGRSDGPVDSQYRVIWPDGSMHWISSRSAPVRDARGRKVRRIGVNWDTTAARQAEIERRDREVAEQSSAAKSHFLARMSHELRTPLNAVLGFAQLGLDDIETERGAGSPAHVRMQHILNAGEHLLALINDVLDLTQLESGRIAMRLTPVPLRALAEESRALVEPLRASLDQAEIVLEGAEGAALADRTRLRQALLNLLTNALKYNRPQGRVTLRCARQDAAVLITVTDQGRGMDAEQLSHLFEPFNRLGVEHGDVEGSGIGLAITKSLIEHMGGTITVRSTPGQGSVFEVSLPSAHAGLDVVPHTPSPRRNNNEPSVARRRVLYIEDNPINAMLVGEMLARRRDLTMQVAPDGRSGLRIAREAPPDLILLDMQLPDMSGIDVAIALQADPRLAGVPCVGVSANAMSTDRDAALATGLQDYWTKPLDLQAFLLGIERILGPTAAD